MCDVNLAAVVMVPSRCDAADWLVVLRRRRRRQVNNQVLENFLAKLELGYSKFANPYHNLLHGADVAQTTNVICAQTGLVVTRIHFILFYVYFGTTVDKRNFAIELK